jgi:hypothetical protein
MIDLCQYTAESLHHESMIPSMINVEKVSLNVQVSTFIRLRFIDGIQSDERVVEISTKGFPPTQAIFHKAFHFHLL